MTLKILISKVKEAEKKWEKQQERGRFGRLILADRDGNDLQRFANDIKDALETLKVGDLSSHERTSLITMLTDICGFSANNSTVGKFVL